VIDDDIAIGQIAKAHGVHGECLTEFFGDSLSKIVLPWDVELSKTSGEVL